MTNEEKAKEICGGNFIAFNKEFSAALQMAEWKDHQFKEYLEGKIEPYIRTNASPQGTYQEGFDDGYTSAINEIINELFKEE